MGGGGADTLSQCCTSVLLLLLTQPPRSLSYSPLKAITSPHTRSAICATTGCCFVVRVVVENGKHPPHWALAAPAPSPPNHGRPPPPPSPNHTIHVPHSATPPCFPLHPRRIHRVVCPTAPLSSKLVIYTLSSGTLCRDYDHHCQATPTHHQFSPRGCRS